METQTLGLQILHELEKCFSTPAASIALVKDEAKAPQKVSGDIVFPSSNILGIPDLLLTHQCEELIIPCLPYGKTALSRMEGILHFYVDDTRFDPSLWVNPDKVTKTKCSAFVEPNYTLSLDSPLSWVVWSTYKKRWLARYWQQLGYKVIVDLNVPTEFYPLSLTGVPKGWRSYATRGYPTRIESLEREHALAVEHAGTDNIFFLVYGGERKIWALCKERGWQWLASEDQRSRGVIYG